jgi:hypothetical protein
MPHPALLLALVTAAGAALAGVLWRFGPGLGADFAIRHRPGGRVEVRGRIPRAKIAQIRAFFSRDLAADRAGEVWGWFGPGGTLRLRFRGGLAPGQRQQARNFLIEHLR